MSFSKLMTLGQLRAIGVKDDRWTIQDKLLMYKGIIRIHSREQKNQVKDTNVLKKKNYKKIALLRKEVKELHEQVAVCFHGDISVTRRLLHNHRELQLTFMNRDLDSTDSAVSVAEICSIWTDTILLFLNNPVFLAIPCLETSQAKVLTTFNTEALFQSVIDDLNHRIFCRRKNLNVIRHKKKQKERQLLRTQVQLGDLNCIISSPDFNRMDLKQQAITNAIQNYDVKFCAAKNIQSVYKRMLAILRKDQRYYEAILVTLQNDSNIQHKCLIRATEMGQLAMEEMANLKSEYSRLEKEVRMNMMDREINMREIRDRLVDLHEETQGLVRTESEFDIQMISQTEEPKKKGKDLEQEIRELDEMLTRLREITLVADIENILPSMLETLRQKRRLLEQLKINAAACDDMLNKKNHADLMFYSLYHSGAEAARKYNKEYEALQKKVEAKEEKLKLIASEQNKVSNQSVKLRCGLQRLCQILEEIKTPNDYMDLDVPSWPVHNLAVSLRPVVTEDNQEVNIRPPINQEALRLIHLMESKMRYIKSRLKEAGDPAEQERAFVARFKHVSELMASNLYPPESVMEAPALVVDVVLEDAQVPNRIEVKARSQQIYTEATRNPFEVVESKSKKIGKKKI